MATIFPLWRILIAYNQLGVQMLGPKPYSACDQKRRRGAFRVRIRLRYPSIEESVLWSW